MGEDPEMMPSEAEVLRPMMRVMKKRRADTMPTCFQNLNSGKEGRGMHERQSMRHRRKRDTTQP